MNTDESCLTWPESSPVEADCWKRVADARSRRDWDTSYQAEQEALAAALSAAGIPRQIDPQQHSPEDLKGWVKVLANVVVNWMVAYDETPSEWETPVAQDSLRPLRALRTEAESLISEIESPDTRADVVCNRMGEVLSLVVDVAAVIAANNGEVWQDEKEIVAYIGYAAAASKEGGYDIVTETLTAMRRLTKALLLRREKEFGSRRRAWWRR